MNDYALQNVKEEKDLGILVDDKLKFHTHTSSVIKKANSILGFIKRSFSVLDVTKIVYVNGTTTFRVRKCHLGTPLHR